MSNDHRTGFGSMSGGSLCGRIVAPRLQALTVLANAGAWPSDFECVSEGPRGCLVVACTARGVEVLHELLVRGAARIEEGLPRKDTAPQCAVEPPKPRPSSTPTARAR